MLITIYLISSLVLMIVTLLVYKYKTKQNLAAMDVSTVATVSLIWPIVLVVTVIWYVFYLIAKGVNKL